MIKEAKEGLYNDFKYTFILRQNQYKWAGQKKKRERERGGNPRHYIEYDCFLGNHLSISHRWSLKRGHPFYSEGMVLYLKFKGWIKVNLFQFLPALPIFDFIWRRLFTSCLCTIYDTKFPVWEKFTSITSPKFCSVLKTLMAFGSVFSF